MNSQPGQNTPRRNDPCPCGSGKKYKQCCGALGAGTSTKEVAEIDKPSTSIDKGFTLYNRGDIAGAMDVATRVLESDQDLPEAYALKGMCNYAQGNLYEAKQDFIRADELSSNLKNGQDVSSIKLSLATLELDLGNSADAEQYAREAIQLGLNTSASHNQLGAALAAQKKFKESIEAFDDAIALNPGDAQLLVNKGGSLYYLGEIHEAKACYRKALDLSPQLAQAHIGMGAVLLVLAKYKKAIAHFEAATKSGQIDASLARNMGVAYMNIGRLRTAQGWLQKSIDMDPDQAKTYVVLGQVLADRGAREESDKMFARALELEPRNEALLIAIAQSKEQLNSIKDAEDLVYRILDLNLGPDNSHFLKARILLSRILKREMKPDEAAEILGEIEATATSNAEVASGYYYELGAQLDKAGKYHEAFTAFARANSSKNHLIDQEFKIDQFRKTVDVYKEVFTETLLTKFRDQIGIDNSQPQPVFIVGFPRSGTTLLEQILGSHSIIGAGGELVALSEMQGGISDILGNQQQYPDILNDLTSTSVENIENLRSSYFDFVNDQVDLEPGKKWFTDKMPGNLEAMGLISLLFPESPIIHIRRHPLSSCLSTFMTEFRHGHEFSLNINDTAEYYLEQMKLAEYYKSNLQLRYLEVRYEDLVQDTENIVRQVLVFIGVEWDPACLEFYKSRRSARTASYEQVTKNIYSDSVMRHEHYADHLAEVARILEPVIQNY